jgi:hypothetical protein
MIVSCRIHTTNIVNVCTYTLYPTNYGVCTERLHRVASIYLL